MNPAIIYTAGLVTGIFITLAIQGIRKYKCGVNDYDHNVIKQRDNEDDNLVRYAISCAKEPEAFTANISGKFLSFLVVSEKYNLKINSLDGEIVDPWKPPMNKKEKECLKSFARYIYNRDKKNFINTKPSNHD